MKRWAACLSVIGLLAAPAAWAQAKGKKTAKDQAERPVVVVSEEYYVNLAALPAILTDDGLKAFQNHQYQVAGNDFTNAGRIFEIQAKSMEDKKARDELMQAGEQMARIGEKVSDGKIKSQADLEREIASVSYHRARFHHFQAIEAWNEKEVRRAAHDLSAAAIATERGFKFAGAELSKGSTATLNGAKRFSDKVLQGGEWTTAEVSKAMDDVGAEVKALGDQLEKRAVAH